MSPMREAISLEGGAAETIPRFGWMRFCCPVPYFSFRHVRLSQRESLSGSFVLTMAVFLVLPAHFAGSSVMVTVPPPPGGIARSNWAVHPQPTITSRISSTSFPVFRIRKSC